MQIPAAVPHPCHLGGRAGATAQKSKEKSAPLVPIDLETLQLAQRQDKQGVENSETTPGILESEPRGPVEKQTKKHT